jgi:hypothetical protein
MIETGWSYIADDRSVSLVTVPTDPRFAERAGGCAIVGQALHLAWPVALAIAFRPNQRATPRSLAPDPVAS